MVPPRPDGPPPMALPIYHFAPTLNPTEIITYHFWPTIREEGGDGPVCLERTSRARTPSDTDLILKPEPKNGDILYEYLSRDGAIIRYEFDKGSRNGKDYVIAVHREPENWTRLRKEDLGFKDHVVGFGGDPPLRKVEKRRDSKVDEDWAYANG
ncbi:hypothetical protein M011DRAFT_471396 [Sporormia fimetaria CBS 119925]|uniref:Uncharacterized protein n=1 Tax=Sporormia fimetaria CBS 119925 TaxID=1340428 RepID=A0A6A6V147_9PLEO|nr:hypothetical protein M011DRAFT_471396 [Sporormia fimetaria CBS 119925]